LLGYSNRNNIILELNEKDKIGDYPFKEIKKKKKRKKWKLSIKVIYENNIKLI